MQASVRYVPGGGFVARSDSNHAVVFDWAEQSGGTGSAATPVEMVLMALGACTAIDVVSILEKVRSPAASLRVELSAERSEAHPRVFTKIHLEYILKGEGIKPAAVDRAIKLSEEKYCSVGGMLGEVARITSSFTIEP